MSVIAFAVSSKKSFCASLEFKFQVAIGPVTDDTLERPLSFPGHAITAQFPDLKAF